VLGTRGTYAQLRKFPPITASSASLSRKHPAAFLMSRVDVDTWMTGSDGGSLALLVIVRRLRGLDYGLGGQIRGIASRLFLR
jgi:hypothetical protein